MLDLSKSVGFPFTFNESLWNLVFPEDYFNLDKQTLFTINNSSIKKYYLNPVTVLIKKIYASFWLTGKAGIWAEMPFRFKFIALNKDYVGIEPIKTKSIIVNNQPRLIDVLYGQVMIIMFPQDIKTYSLDDKEHRVIISTLETGDKMIVPADFVYTIINVNPAEFAIILEVHHKEQPKDSLFVRSRGAPFYYVLRNTSHEIVKNPEYRFINKYAKLEQGRLKLLKKYNVSPKTPVLKQITRKVALFTELLSTHNDPDIANDLFGNIDEIISFSHPRF